jgi:cell division protein FtsB
MIFRRFLALLLVVVVLAGASPAAAADSAATARRKREQARQKKAQVAAQINELKASDLQLERAVAALTEGAGGVGAGGVRSSGGCRR